MAVKLGLRLPDELRTLPVEEVSAFARETGLDAVDLLRYSPEMVQAYRAQGVGIGSVDGIFSGKLISPASAVREQAVAELCRQIDAMTALDLKVLFLCLVPEDDHQSIAQSLEIYTHTFPAIAAACEAAGVRIALEGWPGPTPYYPTLGYTPEVWRAMFRAVPSSSIGLCFDPSHLVRMGIDYFRVLEEFKDRIVHCHGKDTDWLSEGRYLYGTLPAALDPIPDFSDGPWRYCIPGTGLVNWAAISFALEQAGYQGCVSIELEDARYCGTADKERQGVRKAFEFLSRHFA
jgi:sugar phosphate isomerase/epimerase